MCFFVYGFPYIFCICYFIKSNAFIFVTFLYLRNQSLVGPSLAGMQ